MVKAQVVQYTCVTRNWDPCKGTRVGRKRELVLRIPGESPIYIFVLNHVAMVHRRLDNPPRFLPFLDESVRDILAGPPEVVGEIGIPDESVAAINRYLDSLQPFYDARTYALRELRVFEENKS